jgi:hypothetical protein
VNSPHLLQPIIGAHHPNLHDLQLKPCSAADLATAGRNWALLGLVRLHLLVPPAGVDPAGKYGLQRDHCLRMADLQLEAELRVRREFQELPG